MTDDGALASSRTVAQGSLRSPIADGTTDIECPRCHGTGIAADVEGRECQICQGTGTWIDWGKRREWLKKRGKS